jgi:ribonuclease BN (tRNA processing enzyme)
VSEIVFVGTSDAFGAGGRRQSAIILRTASGTTLIDCGATTGTGLHALGISREEIDTILLSHFHADHFGGVPLHLLAALYEDERTKPLYIAGPPGVEARVRTLAAAMGHAIESREWSFEIRFSELPAGHEVEVGPARVRSFETHHSPESVPHGMIIESSRERVAYSGDTGWFDALPGHVAESDLFISECTYHEHGFEYHLNHKLLLENRHRFDCGRIVLTHLGSEMSERRGRCEFETADDGLTLQL